MYEVNSNLLTSRRMINNRKLFLFVQRLEDVNRLMIDDNDVVHII